MAHDPDELPTHSAPPPQEPPPDWAGGSPPPPAPPPSLPAEPPAFQPLPAGPAGPPAFQPGAGSSGARESAPRPQAGYSQPAAPGQAGAAGAGRTPAMVGQQKRWQDLALLGQAAGIAGLLLLLAFFLPWLFSPAFGASVPPGLRAFPTLSHSGWSVANGVPIFDASTQLALFPHLWLVPLCALALMIVAGLLRMGRLSVRLASLLMVGLALLALLMEFFFLMQINSIERAFSISQVGITSRQAAYGLAWGFWLAVIVTVVALGIGLFLLLQEYGLAQRLIPSAPTPPGGPEQPMRPTA